VAAHRFEQYDVDGRLAALALLINPRRWIHRIVESFETSDYVVRRHVSMHFTLPVFTDNSPQKGNGKNFSVFPPAVVPIMFAKRGTLLDNLDVLDAGDRRLPVLCHGEHQEFARILLERLAILEAGEEYTSVSDLSADARAKVSSLVDIPDLEVAEAGKRVSEFFNNEAESRGSEDLERICRSTRLRDFAHILASHYVLLTEVNAALGSRNLIKYVYDSPYATNLNPGPWERIRQLLGHKPYSFRLVMVNVSRCESYHFRMPVPPEHFVARQGFLTLEKDEQEQRSDHVERLQLSSAVFPPDVMDIGADRVGAPYAHLYVGGSQVAQVPDPLFVRVIFYERPPGSMGLALAMAILMIGTFLAFLTNVVGLLNSRVAIDDTAPLLLALPGTATVWLRRSLSGIDLLVAPVRARLALLATGMSSYSAAVLLAVARIEHDRHAARWLVFTWWGMVGVLIVLAISVGRALIRNLRILSRAMKG